MNKDFTDKLKEWLDTPAEQRDFEQGATMLLQLNRNRVMYLNILRNPKKFSKLLEYQLQKWYNMRIQRHTHSDVEKMASEVSSIAEKEHLTADNDEGFKKGKRGDHDSLPDEIKALYVENLSILQRMREVHLRLRMMSEQAEDGKVCRDSDRYPFLQEIIKLDKQYRANWKAYDTYTGTDGEAVALASADEEDKKVLRLINLQKGKYKKNPSSEMKEKILALYSKLNKPSSKITEELKELGILQ